MPEPGKRRNPRQNAAYARLLQRVAMGANQASTLDEAFYAVLDTVCECMKWPIGHIYIREGTSSPKLISTRIWHLDDPARFEQFRRFTEEATMGPGIDLAWGVLASGKPAWVPDVTQVANFSRAALAKELKVKAGFAFPIVLLGEVVGVFEFFSPKAREPTGDLYEVMDKVGVQLSCPIGRARAEQALRESERRHRLILDSAYSAFIGTDTLGVITDWNSQAESTFGWSRAEAIGKALLDLIATESYRTQHLSQVERFIAKPDLSLLQRRLETDLIRKNREIFPAEVTITPVQLSGPYIFAYFIHDISARRADEKAKGQLTEELIRSNNELQQFAYVACHDLQEPLRQVSIYLELLSKRHGGKLDKEADKFIHIATTSARRMKALVEDLLEFSRTASEDLKLESTDCSSLVDEIIAGLKPLLEEMHAEITRDSLPTIIASRLIGLVFENLLGNAVKFRGESSPRVHISAQEKKEEWEFSVKDNGIGIEKEYTDRIFLIFQRLHSPEKYPGTGIGLAICKRIIGRYGGRIWVESTPGQGSNFLFTIPKKVGNEKGAKQ